MELHFMENLFQECSVTLIFTSIFLLLTIVFFKLKNRNLPPGPTGIPVLGYWPFLNSKTTNLQFIEFAKKYGDVFSISIAGKLYIYLGSIKSLREAHVTKSDSFMGRVVGFSTFTCFFQEGMFAVNGDKWKVLRKFFIQKFREFGVSSGKDTSGAINDAIETTMATLRATNRAPTDIMSILNVQYSTVIRRMFFNDDCASSEDILEIVSNYEGVLNIFTNKIILLAGNLPKYLILPFDKDFQNARALHKKIGIIMKKIINTHKDSFDEQSIRNVIDSFYKEKKERASKNDPTANYFTDQALASSMLQFVGDGILGLAAFVTYHLQALIAHPEEQEKIFKELEDVIGPDNQPTLEDRNRLPYTNAFMQEVGRASDFITYFPSLECTKETTVGGYRIPEGAITITGFSVANKDPKVYDEPNTFNPSRFLKQAGKDKTELPVLFGVGKRSCAGEVFASSQTFLLIATLVKNFRIEVPKGSSTISYLDGQIEIIAHPRKET